MQQYPFLRDFFPFLDPKSQFLCNFSNPQETPSKLTLWSLTSNCIPLHRCLHDFLMGRSTIVKLSKLIALADLIRMEVTKILEIRFISCFQVCCNFLKTSIVLIWTLFPSILLLSYWRQGKLLIKLNWSTVCIAVSRQKCKQQSQAVILVSSNWWILISEINLKN